MKKIVENKRNVKHYNRNRLNKRIARVMRFSNSISVIFLIVVMTMGISFLVAFIGKGFTSYVAGQIAGVVERNYLALEDKREFIAMVDEEMMEEEMKAKKEVLSEREMAELEAMWAEFEDVRGIHRLEMEYDLLADTTYFEYKIHYDGRVIFDSYYQGREMNALNSITKDNTVNQKLFTESFSAFRDETGKKIGSVSVSVSPDIIELIYLVSISLAVVVFAMNLIISKIITVITSKIVSRPLEALADQMEVIANDDLETAINSKIKIKRPISEVKSLTDSTMQIMHKMAHYYELMTAQNQELEAQRDELESQRDEMESQNEELEAQRDELEAQRNEMESQNDQLIETGSTLQSMNNAYLSRTLKLQNLLDNVGQGFMTFGSDLVVNSEYSLACQEMVCGLGGNSHHSENHRHEIKGLNVVDLLFELEEQREFIEELLIKVINGSEQERALFIPLLPEEVYNNNRIQKIDYKIVKNERFEEQMLIILTDITLTRELEKQMSVERDILQMIVKVLLNKDEFVDLLEELEAYLVSSPSKLTQGDYDEQLRIIHTLKGSFAQYYLNNTSDYLDEIESQVYNTASIEAIQGIDKDLIRQKVRLDLDIIESYVGEDFIYNREAYTVKEEKILEIEEKIKNLLPATEFNKIIPIIQSIRYKSVKEGLKAYPDYVAKLSTRMDKSVVPFEIQGPDVFVDFDVYQRVFKSMVHLFRNAVDHGIEEADERLELGKQLSARVSCEIISKGSSFDIVVKDDGRGMDAETILKIFDQGFTTKEEATAISGRGVGLSALKSAVEELGGEVKATSVYGSGAEFTITLPLLQGVDIVRLEPESFMTHIDTITRGYMETLKCDCLESDLEYSNKIQLHRVSALLNMKGSIDGIVILSVNEAAAKRLVSSFVIEEISEQEIKDYAEDVLGEVINTIIGNVLGDLEEEGVFLSIGVPVVITNTSAYIKYSDSQILTLVYDNNDFIMNLSLLITEGNNIGSHINIDDVIIEEANKIIEETLNKGGQ